MERNIKDVIETEDDVIVYSEPETWEWNDNTTVEDKGVIMKIWVGDGRASIHEVYSIIRGEWIDAGDLTDIDSDDFLVYDSFDEVWDKYPEVHE